MAPGKHTQLLALAVGLLGCGLDGDPRIGGQVPAPAPPPSLVDGGGPPPTAPPAPGTDAGASPTLDSGPTLPDADTDGVPDGQDRCSHTTLGAAVWTQGDWAGCAAGQLKDADDGDRDGVPNGTDKCPGTPVGTTVYKTGTSAGCPTGGGTTPPPTPPPPPPDAGTAPGFTLSAKEQDLLKALNDARAKNGLPSVAADAKLTCAARMHANDAAGGCDHTGSDGSWPWDRAQKCGFPQSTWTVNEICAGPGFTSGPEAVWGWQQSSGHWAAIVHSQAKLVGLGVGSNGCYVALFDCCVAGS